MPVKNIILIGMPGAGKSTIGNLLAKTLGMPFIDTDRFIEQGENMTLQDIINKKGLKSFLEIEEKAVLRLQTENHVIATGGSVVYSSAAMSYLKSGGIIVYLQLQHKRLKRRIRNIDSRGIAMDKGQTLLELYNERVPLYEKCADITVDCSGKQAEDVAAEITQIIQDLKKL